MTHDSMLTKGATHLEAAAPDVWNLRILFVNVIFIGKEGTPDWVLVDAGLKGFGDSIRGAANKLFTGPPKAIILTHGHFDHVGALHDLLETWPVPVFAHPLEMPHLTGIEDYPEPDPTVGGGLMAASSPLYSNKAIDLGDKAQEIQPGGVVPGLPDWRWIHTPGHSNGHISLFREHDRTMITGDAFISVKQESALDVIRQKKEIHGPPTYFTPDWMSAWESVKRLAALKPLIAVTGHGQPLSGEELTGPLDDLAYRFGELSIPDKGKYV